MTTIIPSIDVEERERLRLLCACIRFDADADRAAALGRAIAATGWGAFLACADRQRLGSVVARAIARLKLAPPVPLLTLPDGRMSLTEGLRQREAEHMSRRAAFASHLAEIAAAFNRRGIVPIALKGGSSIVTGVPDWRSLRDLDLLVPGRRDSEAQAILVSLGYRTGRDKPRWAHHHFPELFRDDLPGWIEIHRHAGPSRVSQFLPTAELLAAAAPPADARVGGVAVLTPHLQALHGLLHHHVGHRAVKQARIDLKGLYEFAAAIEAMAESERELLWQRSSRHPRLLAMVDLWLAAAADLFGLPVTAPALAPDMRDRWRRLREGTEPAGMVPELTAALEPARLGRVRGGKHALSRLWWRITVPLTFLKRPTLSPLSLLRGLRDLRGQGP